MKATASPTIVNPSGAIGGTVYANHPGSTVIRRAPTRVRSSSIASSRACAHMVEASRAWSTLTDSRRAHWQAIAAEDPAIVPAGQTRRSAGFELFMTFNMFRLAIGLAIQPAPFPPVPMTMPTVAPGTINLGASQLNIVLTGQGGSVTGLAIFASRPVPPGQTPGPSTSARYLVNRFANGSYNMYTAYQTAFGALSSGLTGWKVRVRVVPYGPNGNPGTPAITILTLA